LAEVFRLTKGYPYFLQEWGYQAWNLAEASPMIYSPAHGDMGFTVPLFNEVMIRAIPKFKP
jgi:hypothetical protein